MTARKSQTRIILTLALLTAAGPAWPATPWPTTHFLVDFSPAATRNTPGQATAPVLPDTARATMPPATEGEDELDVFGNRQLAYDALAMFFEQSLNDAAKAFQAAGYEAPNLPLFHDDHGNIYYKLQVTDETRDRGLADNLGVYHRVNACGDVGVSAGSSLSINSETFHPLTPAREVMLYVTLAHELAHAIQASYPATVEALFDCAGNTYDNNVIVEGTADALAYMLARRHWPKYYREYHSSFSHTNEAGETLEMHRFLGPDGQLDGYLTGLRSYGQNFLDLSAAASSDRRLAAYNTSSFWYNLMDRFGIGLVDHLLRQPLSYSDFPSTSEWLDGALRSWTPALDGLVTVYPHFVADFASQAGSRFALEELPNYSTDQTLTLDPDSGAAAPDQQPTDDDDWRISWISRVLGDCQQVELTPDSPDPGEARFTLDRVAAGCLDIRWSGFTEGFELYIEAEHASLRLIDQVHLGIIYQRANGAEQYCHDAVKPHYDDPLWSCTHEKPFLSGGPQPLVYTKRWSEPDIHFSAAGRRIMAVSNVAANARRSGRFSDGQPLVIRVGIASAQADDGRSYDPPYSAFKGMPAMGAAMNVGLGGGAIGMDKQTQYGITSSPTPAMMLLNFGLPVAGSDDAYGVSWSGEPPALGYRGPFNGMVSAPQAKGSVNSVSSMLCARHRDGAVGQVLRFDRDYLWIDIDAELCQMSIPPPADGNFPVVDRVKASLRLPFGWQYDPASAPADIVTPGMEIMIDRHARRVPRVLAGTWGTPGDGEGTATNKDPAEDAGDGSAPPGADAGGGGYSVLNGGPCSCSCDEVDAFDKQGEAAKAAGDNKSMMGLASEMMRCHSKCQQQYLLCRLGMPP